MHEQVNNKTPGRVMLSGSEASAHAILSIGCPGCWAAAKH